jgi:hypothetical protein
MTRITKLDVLLEYTDSYDDTAVPAIVAYLKLEKIASLHPRYLQQLARMLVFMSKSEVQFNYSGAVTSLRRLYRKSPEFLLAYQELVKRGLLVELPALDGVNVAATNTLSHLIETLEELGQ